MAIALKNTQRNRMVLMSFSKRFRQTPALSTSVWDNPARVMVDPLLCRLDFRPIEIREGYTGMFFMYGGLLIVLFPALLASLLSAWTLLWYSFRDTTTRVWNWDDVPAFKVRHGRDMVSRIDPALGWAQPFGFTGEFDPKMIYHFEIADALKRKEKLVKEGKFEFYL